MLIPDISLEDIRYILVRVRMSNCFQNSYGPDWGNLRGIPCKVETDPYMDLSTRVIYFVRLNGKQENLGLKSRLSRDYSFTAVRYFKTSIRLQNQGRSLNL